MFLNIKRFTCVLGKPAFELTLAATDHDKLSLPINNFTFNAVITTEKLYSVILTHKQPTITNSLIA